MVQTVSSVSQTTITTDPLVCLLGALAPKLYQPGVNLIISCLLYLARKLIARYWMASTIPSIKQWIECVNSLLPSEQLAHRHHNAICMSQLVWQGWLDSPGLAPPQLVMDKLLQMQSMLTFSPKVF